MSFHRLIIVGHVGRAPEYKETESGTNTCRFSVATSEKRGGDEHTEWFRCVAFNRTAEVARDYLDKGVLVGVEGRLRTSEYTTKDGERKSAVEVMVDNLRLLGGRSSSTRDARQDKPDRPTRKDVPATDQQTRRVKSDDGFDDDIPF